MSELLGWYGCERNGDMCTGSFSRDLCSGQIAQDIPPAQIERNLSSDHLPSDNADEPEEDCSWCGRRNRSPWEPEISYSLSHDVMGEFCSASCFSAATQRRRILERAFKRKRSCDWCRQDRSALSYVDFQDGKRLLQFCSDKCLNRYKMNIFCRETEIHLALYDPSSLLPTDDLASGADDGLITPDLWLRNCSSPPNNSTAHLFLRDEIECKKDNGDKGDTEGDTDTDGGASNQHYSTLYSLRNDGQLNQSTAAGDMACNLTNHLPLENCEKCFRYAQRYLSRTKALKVVDASLSTAVCKSTERSKESMDTSAKVINYPTQFRSTSLLPALALLVPFPIPIPVPVPVPVPVPIPIPISSPLGLAGDLPPVKTTANGAPRLSEKSSVSLPVHITGPTEPENIQFRSKRRKRRRRRRTMSPSLS